LIYVKLGGGYESKFWGTGLGVIGVLKKRNRVCLGVI